MFDEPVRVCPRVRSSARLLEGVILACLLLAGLAPLRAADDFLDVVTTDRDNLWIFLGDGEGGFADPIRLDIGFEVEPWHVVTGDIDGDGDTDIVSANRFGPSISIHRNRGDGTFEDATIISTNSRPYDVDLGDLDGDGAPEIVVTCNNDPGPVEIRYNDGDGVFDEVEFYFPVAGELEPFNSVIADFDDDGSADLAITENESDNITILLNDGEGDLLRERAVPVEDDPKPITAGHVNDDGFLDLVVAHTGAGTIGVLHGDGEGNFTLDGVYPAGVQPREVEIADMDLDGHADILVAAGRNTDYIAVLMNEGDGTFAPQQIFVTGPRPNSVAAGDFDGDGLPDVAVANWSLDNPSLATFSVLFGDGEGGFPEIAHFTPPGGFLKITALAVGHFNSQGFVRGDVNLDDRVNVSDVIHLLRHLFVGWSIRCQDSADANDTGTLDVTDAVVQLEFLFLNGPAFPPPYPQAGIDPTPDELGCDLSPSDA